MPFQAAIDAGVKAIMTGHSIYPAYDDTYPTTLSEKILTGLLRGEMGFDGVIVSDAIGMAAILKKWPLPQACAMAIKAGVDTILLKADDESRSQCFFGIKMAIESGDLSEERLDDAVTRNNQLLSKKLKKDGHQVVVVTNNPYVEGTTKEADVVICNFSGTPDSIRSSADLLFGKFKPLASTKLTVKLPDQEGIPEKKLKARKKHPLNLSYC